MKDDIGIRMKDYYESRNKCFLTRRTYTIIRIDGKAFHTYTRGLSRPFDDELMSDMDETAKFLCENIQGTKFAYVQSDEISLLLTDFDKLNTDAWFDGNTQKITSVSASLATGKFNQLRPGKLAFFDSRVFTIPNPVEVENYFIWRQQDAVRNSIQSTAQSLYSDKELKNKNTMQMQEMCFKKGVNWNDMLARYKRGRMIEKDVIEVNEPISRNKTGWIVTDPPIFTKQREYLVDLIPLDDN